MILPNLIFAVSAALIAWAGFCRLTRVDLRALARIRLAIYAVTVTSLWAGTSVLIWGHGVTWPVAAMAAAMAGMMAITSPSWRRGVPDVYVSQRGDIS